MQVSRLLKENRLHLNICSGVKCAFFQNMMIMKIKAPSFPPTAQRVSTTGEDRNMVELVNEVT